MNFGISKEALVVFSRLNSEITEDLVYGKILRRLVISGANHGLLDAVLMLSQQNPKLRTALFNCVSGHKSFKSIWEETRELRLLLDGIKFLTRRILPVP